MQLISSTIVLISILSSLPKFLLCECQSLLAYSPCTSAIIVQTIQFLFDTVKLSVFQKKCGSLNNLFVFLNNQKYDYLHHKIYDFYSISSIIFSIFLRVVQSLGYFIIKENLTILVDKHLRSRLRNIYDGICPLLGKTVTSMIIILLFEFCGSFYNSVLPFTLIILSFLLFLYGETVLRI